MFSWKNKKNLFFAFVFLIGGVFISKGLYSIYQYDKSNNNITVAKPFKLLQTNQSTQKSAIIEAIELLKQANINTLILEEESIESLINEGKVTLQTGAHLLNSYRVGRVYRSPVHNLKRGLIEPKATYLFVNEFILYERIRNFLLAKFGTQSIKEKGWNTLEIFLDPETIKQTGIGFSEKNQLFFKSLAVQIIPEITIQQDDTLNYHTLKLKNILEIIKPKILITHYPDGRLSSNILNKHQDFFIQNAIHNVFIEFKNNPNQNQVSQQIPGHTLKAHNLDYYRKGSLQKPKNWFTRYLRSIKERRVKLIILDPSPLKELFNLSNSKIQNTYKKLTQMIQEMGYQINQESIVYKSDWQALSFYENLAIQICAFFLIIIFLKTFIHLNAILVVFSILAITVSILIQSNFHYSFFIQNMLSLLISCFAPAYVFVKYFPEINPVTTSSSKFRSLTLFILKSVSVMTFSGLLITLLHSNLIYINGFTKFFGVKLSFVLPLIFVALSFYHSPDSPFSFGHIFNRVFKLPLTIGSSVATVFGAIIIFIYIFRSGNYFAIPFSEILFREFLESTFFIRPRIKEFLIGYPLILFNIYMIGSFISKKWLWFFNMIASIAFISLLNSLLHFHTPIQYSLFRSILGIVLGMLVGSFIIFGLRLFKLSGFRS